MQQQQIKEDYSTIRISRKTLDQLGKHAKYRDNWDAAVQRVLKKAEYNTSKLQPFAVDGGSF